MTATQAQSALSPEHFFSTILPLCLSRSRWSHSPGTVSVHLLGHDGGAWTICLKQRSVRRGAARDAELHLEMESSDFVAMMRGQLDGIAAVLAGRVRYCGQIRLLSQLATIMESVARVSV